MNFILPSLALSNNLVRSLSTTTLPMKFLRISLCQVQVGVDKLKNINHVSEIINKASSSSELVVLPECWNSPYSTVSFPKYAEVIPNINEKPNDDISPSTAMLCNLAKSKNIWIVGGSIPEREDNKLFNTCIVVNYEGEIIGKHRKVHLFDIDVPGKIKFKESDSLTAGNSGTLFNTPWGMIGIGICYDIRFPEYAMMLREQGARMLIYPGAFNMITGPSHWELLQRARAIDNQLYVLTCSPARDESKSGGYIAWGHSSVISPW